MTTAEKKDWILTEINKAGVIDVSNFTFMNELDEKRYWLYHEYKHLFIHRGFVKEDMSPPSIAINIYYRVTITEFGSVFLSEGGFQAEEAQKNAEFADKIDIKQAIIHTARWQRNGVWASLFIGVATIGITFYAASKTANADGQTERINRLEERLDSMSRAMTITNPTAIKETDTLLFSVDTTATMHTPKR